MSEHPDLDVVEAAIKKLRLSYEKYFAGVERLEPVDERERVKTKLRRLRDVYTVNTARKFWEERRVNSTIDLLGEELDTDEDVQYSVGVYERLIDTLGRQEFATISLKPTQLGSHKGTEHCKKIIESIVARAAEHDIKVTLDMEDHSFTDMTLDIFRAIYKEFPTFGTVLQSRLFRTDDDIKSWKKPCNALKKALSGNGAFH